MCTNLAQEMQFIGTPIPHYDARTRDAIAGGLEQRERDHGPTASARTGDLWPDTCDARCPAEARASCWGKSLRTHLGRKRYRKRHHCQAVTSLFAVGEWSLCEGELSGDPGNPAGKRAVRLRKRRIHRSLQSQAWPGRIGASGHPLSGRDRRTGRGVTGEASAASAGWPIQPDRRAGGQEGRGAGGVRYQPRIARGDRAGKLPARPVLPHRHHDDSFAAAARARRRTCRSSAITCCSTTTRSSMAG